MGKYLDQIKSSSPAAYNKIADLAKYTANDKFGGELQDYQAQIFTPLNSDIIKNSQSLGLTYTPKKTIWATDENGGPYQAVVGGDPILPEGVKTSVNYDSEGNGGLTYTKDLGNVNGVPVTAIYDASGKLTGYQGDTKTRSFLDGSHSVSGAWDAQGNPVPQQYFSSGGGFLGNAINDIGSGLSDFLNSDIGKIAAVAAMYYGGPAALEALSSGAAASAPEAIAMSMPEAAAIAAPEAIGGLQASTAFDGLLPAGSAYAAPEVSTLGAVAGDTAGMSAGEIAGMGGAGGLAIPAEGAAANLAEMGGAQGLTSGAGTSLAEMGGAQGLTTAGAAGGLLGAAGLTSGLSDAAAAGIGTGIGLGSVGAVADASTALGAAGAAGAGTLTGSALGDMAAIGAGSSLVGGVLQSNAAKEAAQIQADATAKSLAQQQKNFDTISQQQAPYRAAGYTALNNIAGMTSGQTPQYDASGNVVKDANGNPVMNTGSGYLQHQFDATDLQKGLAPNYDFMLNQGQMTNQRAANMGGGAIGGNALQGLNKYTQDYAGNAYQNAFTNYQNQRSNIYNTLASIAGIGQTGQNATNTAATNATNNATNLNVGSASANAAGTVGSANAYSNAIGNAANSYTLASLLNQRGNVAMPVQG